MKRSPVFTVARFESKTLLRSWFFRIFSFIALAFIFFFNLFGLTNLGGGGWPGRLIPGSVPYMNLFFLNIAQSVIAIFLSSDFLGRDKKLDTTEVFYVRSMSNHAYVLGKTLGIIKVFFILNLIILLIGFIFNLIGNDIVVIPVTYLIYPLLISLPSVVFVLGLSFFLMVLIRNQAITFVLMLGLLGGSLFYFGPKMGGVFDFLAFYTPLVYSEFTGFASLTDILLIRGSYIMIGTGFVLLTVYMLPRLPQERNFKLKVLIVSTLLFAGSLVMLSKYTFNQFKSRSIAEGVIALENTFPAQPQFSIDRNQMTIKHSGNAITVKSIIDLSGINNDNIILLLNPGFRVSSVLVNEQPVKFQVKLHSINIVLPDHMGQCNLEINYKGSPDLRYVYPDVLWKYKETIQRLDPLVAGKFVAFLQNDYILLTRESLWYPVAACRQFRSQPQFTQFKIDFTTNNSIEVYSQGNKIENKNGSVTFEPENKLNALSLVGGYYQSTSVTVDSLEVSYIYYKNNKDMLSYFNLMGDTIGFVVKDIKDQFERDLGIRYPFKRFSLIEVPEHFFSYSRSWTLTTEDNMPEMIFTPERGGGNWSLDLKGQSRRIERRNDSDNDEMLPVDKQIQLFKNIIGNYLITPRGFRFRDQGGVRTTTGWSKQMIFPQYFSYTNVISQNGFPIIQFVTENYLFSQVQGQQRGFGRESVSDQIILKMKGKNLKTILDSMQNDEKFTDFITMKGNQFYNTIQMGLKDEDLEKILNANLKQNRFLVVPKDTFISQLSKNAEFDLNQAIDAWQNNKQIPAFVFGKIKTYEVKDGDKTRFFISLPVANKGECDGIITVGIREQGRGGGRGRGFGGGPPAPSVEQTFNLEKGQNVEIGLMSDNEPREVIIETYVAENIPTTQRLGVDQISKDPVEFFEGMRDYSRQISFEEPYEIIVDNEDNGFSMDNTSETKTLKDWWMGKNDTQTEQYLELNFWNPPSKWSPTLGSNFYGKYIKSAYYKRSGSGNATVKWVAEIPESGNYSVYVYVTYIRGPGRRNDEKGNFKYQVTHDDGTDEFLVEPESRDGEWKYLGDFYFSQGQASVSMSDQSERRIVAADAVKWVRAN